MRWQCHRLDARIVRIDGNVKAELGAHGKHGGILRQPLREVSHELLDKLIHYDPARARAFIAVDNQSQRMLGVVRLHDDTGGENAEFAILVRSRLKGHGVGWLLMKGIRTSRPCVQVRDHDRARFGHNLRPRCDVRHVGRMLPFIPIFLAT